MPLLLHILDLDAVKMIEYVWTLEKLDDLFSVETECTLGIEFFACFFVDLLVDC